MNLHTRVFWRAIIFGRKIEHDDSELDPDIHIPKESPLRELSISLRLDFNGQKLSLIPHFKVKPHFLLGLRE